jgi:hypothetical protein
MEAFWVFPLKAFGPDQENAPPATLLAVRSICSPSHSGPLLLAMTVGCGLTVIVNVIGFPVQLPMTGVTVIVAVTGDPVALVAVYEGRFPEPLAGSPIEGSEFVQLNVAPADPVKFVAGAVTPEQKVCAFTALTVGTPPTVTVTVAVVGQVPAAEVPVTVYVVVAAGLAVTFGPEVGERPVVGDQE